MHDHFPLPDLELELLRPYWEGAAAGELRMPTCDACSRLVWYPEEQCRHCGASSWTWTAVDGSATLFSWVVVTHPFLPAFADDTPFVTALVALDADPAARLATRIVDIEPEDLRFEMALQLSFRPLRFGGVDGEVTVPFFIPT